MTWCLWCGLEVGTEAIKGRSDCHAVMKCPKCRGEWKVPIEDAAAMFGDAVGSNKEKENDG